jgi:hypothetical protein
MEAPIDSYSSKIRLTNTSIRSIKELMGFKKHHRIPQTTKEGLSFLFSLAHLEIENDFDARFSALRNGFGFKRRELTVNEPYEGAGSIETPFFKYEFRIGFADDNPGRVQLQRTIQNIEEPNQILNPIFVEVFGNQFTSLELRFQERLNLEAIVDKIEDLDSEELAVDYDKELTWCQIRFADGSPAVRLGGNGLTISSSLSNTRPADLLSMLATVQQQISQVLRFNTVEADNLLP